MKRCPMCGVTKDASAFYRTSSYCKPCHKQRMLQDRKQPHQQAKTRAAKNAWMKRHPEVNRRNVAAYRARQKLKPAPPVVGSDRVSMREAVRRLGLTKQRIQQLIDRRQLVAIRVGSRWMIERAVLERAVEERAMRTEEQGLRNQD